MSSNMTLELTEALADLDRFRTFLLAVAEGMVSAKKADGSAILDKSSHELAIKARDHLAVAIAQLEKLALDQSIESDQTFALNKVWEAIGWSFALGQMDGSSRVSDQLKDFVKTANMRAAKARKPEVEALRRSIIAERGDGPAERPNKEATAILTAVNQDLVRSGFAPVKLDAVRRVLEKFPRS